MTPCAEKASPSSNTMQDCHIWRSVALPPHHLSRYLPIPSTLAVSLRSVPSGALSRLLIDTLQCFSGVADGGAHPAAHGAHGPEAGGAELSGFGALGTWRKRVARAPLTAEEALKHLLLSVDVDTLYRYFACCK